MCVCAGRVAGELGGGHKQLSQKHFASLSQFQGKVGGKAHSHFGLKDLGHALTYWLTSEQWGRNPGVESELESVSWMTDTSQTDTERLRSESQPAALTYICKLYVYACVCVCICLFVREWCLACLCTALCSGFYLYASVCVNAHTRVRECTHTRVLVVMCESLIVHGNASLPVA